MNLDKIYSLPFFGPRLLNLVVSKEGGEMRSTTLRRLFENKHRISIGLYSYGCFNRRFNTGGTVKMGRYCSIADGVRYFGANHPIEMASTSPYFYNKRFGFQVQDVKRETLTIGHDVWLGYGAVILSSCKTIGNGAVVGAGAVVTKDIPPYAIVAGNPARIIRMRFDDNTIQKLEESRWYEKSPEELIQYYDFMDTPISFANKIKQET